MRFLGTIGITLALSQTALAGYIDTQSYGGGSYSSNSSRYATSDSAVISRGPVATSTSSNQVGVLNKRQETFVKNWNSVPHADDYAKEMDLHQVYKVVVYASITEPVSLSDFGPNMLSEIGSSLTDLVITTPADDLNMIHTSIPEEYNRVYSQTNSRGSTTTTVTTTRTGLKGKSELKSSSSEVTTDEAED